MFPIVSAQQNKVVTQFFFENSSSFIQNNYNDTIEKIKRFKERVRELDRDYAMNNKTINIYKQNKKKKKLPPLAKRNKLKQSSRPSMNSSQILSTEDLLGSPSKKEVNESSSRPKVMKPINEELYKRLLNYKPLPYINERRDDEEEKEKERAKSPPVVSKPNANGINSYNSNTIASKSTYVDSTLSSKNKSLVPLVRNNKKSGFKYTYIVYPGNNKEVIQRCMKTRSDWEEKSKDDLIHVNFIWAPLSLSINFTVAGEFNQWVNHFEYNSEISNKKKLFINLIKYCERYSIDLLSFIPLTIIVPMANQYYINQINAFTKFYFQIDQFVEDHINTNSNVNVSSSTPNPNSNSKGNSPSKCKEEDKKTESKIRDYFLINYSKRLGNSQKLYIPSTHYNNKNLWIIKPVNLNRGRGIKIEHDINKILNEMNQLQQEKKVAIDEAKANIKDKDKEKFDVDYIILQKYIERPLLYHNRKFDIRMWVLITDKYDCYVFKEGHLKETCVEYNINNTDPFVHLTNYSVQKHHNDFSKETEGNEISFASFQAELDKISQKTNGPKINFRADVYTKICKIIKISLLAAKTHINLIGRRNCFEIFGYDFLIDCNYNPYLIEINTNPGLEESSPLIKKLVPRMINDALKLTIDVGFSFISSIIGKSNKDDQSQQQHKEMLFEVEGYTNEENIWEKLKF